MKNGLIALCIIALSMQKTVRTTTDAQQEKVAIHVDYSQKKKYYVLEYHC